MTTTVDPVVTTEGTGAHETKVTRHPAFAQIRASRLQGGAVLYDSEFRHQHSIMLTITRSELHRSLSYDQPSERGELIRLSMSEAQWARFISTLNHGSGTPCTLEHVLGEQIPQLPEPHAEGAQFDDDTKAFFAQLTKHHKALLGSIDALGISEKQKKTVRDYANYAYQHASSNFDFLAKQFAEYTEKKTSKAMAEIEGFMTQARLRVGDRAAMALEPPGSGRMLAADDQAIAPLETAKNEQGEVLWEAPYPFRRLFKAGQGLTHAGTAYEVVSCEMLGTESTGDFARVLTVLRPAVSP